MPETRSSRPEIVALTSARAIAALWVSALHEGPHFGPGRFHFLDALSKRGYLGVDLFFLLSGFVMLYVYGLAFAAGVDRRGYFRFLALRLGRIYPLHLSILAVLVAVELAKLAAHVGSPFRLSPPSSILANLLLVQGWHLYSHMTWDGPAWSISAEWAIYLICPWLLHAVPRLGRRQRAVMLGLTWLGLAGLEAQLHHGLNLTVDYGVPRCLLEFAAGVLLAVTYLELRDTQLGARLGSDACVGVLGLVTAAIITERGADSWVVVSLCPLLLGLALNDGIVRKCARARPLRFLGDISYSFYMCHLIVFHWTNLLLDRLYNHHDQDPSLISFSLGLACIIPVASLTYFVIERPARARVRRWLGPGSALSS